MRIFLAGEGKTDLGGWANEPFLRTPPITVGVIEALLRKLRTQGWEVGGASLWKSGQMYAPGRRLPAEARRLLGLALDAREAECSVLIFVRDVRVSAVLSPAPGP